MRNLFSLLFIGASIGIVMLFARPTWNEISVLQQEANKYNDALSRVSALSIALENQRAIVSSIPVADLERLEKLLPDNVDNVKLIIDINNIAASQGIFIRDIGIAAPKESSSSRTTTLQSGARAGYDSIDLSFTVATSYSNFLSFITALEQSLRLVDITSVSFVPGEANNYNFSVTVRTYWLK